MPQRYQVPIRSQVSILSWIPTRYWDDIYDGVVDNDLSPYLQEAFNEIGSRQIFLETGSYGCATPLVNSQTSLRIQGIGATLIALDDLDTNNDGRGALIYSPGKSFQIEGVTCDLNGFDGNGFFVDRAPSTSLLRSGTIRVPPGYSGVRGGSLLYPVFDRLTFTGTGRNIDLQKGWELVASSSYYGANVGLFKNIQCYCSEGFRLSGGNTLLLVNREGGVNQPTLRNETRGPAAAAWTLGEEIGSLQASNISLIDCYAELSVGTATPLRCISNVGEVNVHIYSGEFFGSSASVVDSVFYAGSIDGLSLNGGPNIKRWYNDYSGSYSGNAGDDILTWLPGGAFAHTYNEMFKTGTGVQPNEVLRNAGSWGDVFYSSDQGLRIAPAIAGIIIQVAPNGTPGDDSHKINLASSNRFYLNPGSAISVDSTFLLNVIAGRTFQLEFSNGNTTLQNATFNLLGGANKTYAAGNIVTFAVDRNAVIRQIGGNA